MGGRLRAVNPRVFAHLEAGSGSRTGGLGGRQTVVILRVSVHWEAGSGSRTGGSGREQKALIPKRLFICRLGVGLEQGVWEAVRRQ